MLCTIVPNVEYKFMKVYFNCMFYGLNAFANWCRHLYSTDRETGLSSNIFNIAGWFNEWKADSFSLMIEGE